MKTSKLTWVLFKKISDETKVICLSALLFKKEIRQLGAKLIKFCCKGEHS